MITGLHQIEPLLYLRLLTDLLMRAFLPGWVPIGYR